MWLCTTAPKISVTFTHCFFLFRNKLQTESAYINFTKNHLSLLSGRPMSCCPIPDLSGAFRTRTTTTPSCGSCSAGYHCSPSACLNCLTQFYFNFFVYFLLRFQPVSDGLEYGQALSPHPVVVVYVQKLVLGIRERHHPSVRLSRSAVFFLKNL